MPKQFRLSITVRQLSNYQYPEEAQQFTWMFPRNYVLPVLSKFFNTRSKSKTNIWTQLQRLGSENLLPVNISEFVYFQDTCRYSTHCLKLYMHRNAFRSKDGPMPHVVYSTTRQLIIAIHPMLQSFMSHCMLRLTSAALATMPAVTHTSLYRIASNITFPQGLTLPPITSSVTLALMKLSMSESQLVDPATSSMRGYSPQRVKFMGIVGIFGGVLCLGIGTAAELAGRAVWGLGRIVSNERGSLIKVGNHIVNPQTCWYIKRLISKTMVRTKDDEMEGLKIYQTSQRGGIQEIQRVQKRRQVQELYWP